MPARASRNWTRTQTLGSAISVRRTFSVRSAEGPVTKASTSYADGAAAPVATEPDACASVDRASGSGTGSKRTRPTSSATPIAAVAMSPVIHVLRVFRDRGLLDDMPRFIGLDPARAAGR